MDDTRKQTIRLHLAIFQIQNAVKTYELLFLKNQTTLAKLFFTKSCKDSPCNIC